MNIKGNPFWSFPKRPPQPVIFDPKNALHSSFVAAFACLRAVIFNVPYPKEPRSEIKKT